MKRHQLRRMIAGNVSDAQLRKAIADLGLPSEDDYDYSEDQAKQILNQFRSQRADSTPNPATTRTDLPVAQATAKQAAEQTQVALVTGHQERLVALSNALDKAEQRRGEVLDRLSDRMAYLQDDGLFMNDLLRLTQQKLKGNQQPDPQPVAVTAIDAFVDAFDVVGSWEIPAIAPSTVLGALPM